MPIRRFEWDKGNTEHIAERHNLLEDEVEEVFLNNPVIRKIQGERLVAYGQTDSGRYLTVFFHRKSDGKIRVVTARDSNRWERRYYRKMRRD